MMEAKCIQDIVKGLSKEEQMIHKHLIKECVEREKACLINVIV